MDRSRNNRADNDGADLENAPRESQVVKEREKKEDGRYIIFYSFGDDAAREAGDG